MSKIRVNTQTLIQQQQQIEQLAGQLENISEEINYVSRNLSWQISSREQIKNRLNEYGRYTGNLQRKTQSLSVALGTAGDYYQSTCKKVAGWTVKGTEENHQVSGGENKKAEDTGGGGQGSAWLKYLKKIGKGGLDAIGKAGAIGGMLGAPIALLKILIDNDGFTGKDIGAVIKGAGGSVLGWMKSKDAKGIKELLGLEKYKTISTGSSKAGWLARLDNAKVTGVDTLKEELLPITKVEETGKYAVKGTKVAGWALSLVANGFSNYEEYNKKLGTGEEISQSRAVAETVTETLIDIGKGAAIAAGVAAGCAAIGVAAPAVVVGGIGVGVSVVADIVCENLTGSSVTEFVSDKILDGATAVGKKVTGAVSSAGKAVSGWFKKMTGGGKYAYSGG